MIAEILLLLLTDMKKFTVLKAVLRVTSETWSSDLTNKSSPRYTSLEAKVLKAVSMFKYVSWTISELSPNLRKQKATLLLLTDQ